jgi:hypothetical protein
MAYGLLSGLLLALVLSACQTTPDQGGLGRVEVVQVPAKRSDMATNQQVAEQLEVYEKEIRQGRLIKVNCAYADATAAAGVAYWNGLALMPAAGAYKAGAVLRIARNGSSALPEQVFDIEGEEQAPAADRFISYSYPQSKTSSRAVACEWGPGHLPVRVQALDKVPAFELDFSRAERARHRQFTDAELASGRIGLGVCALRDLFGDVYYQPVWLFRVPEGLSIAKGEVVELQLGEAESSMGVGRISQMTRRLGRRVDFPNDGRATVFCK